MKRVVMERKLINTSKKLNTTVRSIHQNCGMLALRGLLLLALLTLPRKLFLLSVRDRVPAMVSARPTVCFLLSRMS